VDVGDEKRIARDWAASVREYRVALTMDVCNGYGWLGVGEVAASNERPDLAAHALLNATQMLPQHYGAFTSLGKAYEALGQVPLAAEAYRRALEISPSLMEARAGLARTAP
jgi:cytochrome c-type biogenesis protein CcmH/NrfG